MWALEYGTDVAHGNEVSRPMPLDAGHRPSAPDAGRLAELYESARRGTSALGPRSGSGGRLGRKLGPSLGPLTQRGLVDGMGPFGVRFAGANEPPSDVLVHGSSAQVGLVEPPEADQSDVATPLATPIQRKRAEGPVWSGAGNAVTRTLRKEQTGAGTPRTFATRPPGRPPTCKPQSPEFPLGAGGHERAHSRRPPNRGKVIVCWLDMTADLDGPRRRISQLHSDLKALVDRDPDQEVWEMAIPTLDAVLAVVRRALPDDPVLSAVQDFLSPEAIAQGERLRATDALVIVGQVKAAIPPETLSPPVWNADPSANWNWLTKEF